MGFEFVETDEGRIKVELMPGDGNCLLSAICHQLYKFRVGSIDHKTLIREYRKKIVTFLRENMHVDSVRNSVLSRIFEDMPELVELTESQKFEEFFQYIDQDGVWGGEETIVATMLMLNVRIVIHREGGIKVVLSDINKNNTEIDEINIVYRLGEHARTYTHYDSLYISKKELQLGEGGVDSSAEKVDLKDDLESIDKSVRTNDDCDTVMGEVDIPARICNGSIDQNSQDNIPTVFKLHETKKTVSEKSTKNTLMRKVVLGSLYIEYFEFNLNNIPRIETIIVEQKLDICCVQGYFTKFFRLDSLVESYKVLMSKSTKSILIYKNRLFGWIRNTEGTVQSDGIDIFALTVTQYKIVSLIILWDLNELSLTKIRQMLKNKNTYIVICGYVPRIIGHHLFYNFGNEKKVDFIKNIKPNKLKGMKIFAAFNSLQETEIKRKHSWYYRAQAMLTSLKNELSVKAQLKLFHIPNDKVKEACTKNKVIINNTNKECKSNADAHFQQTVGRRGFFVTQGLKSTISSLDVRDCNYIGNNDEINEVSWNVRGCVESIFDRTKRCIGLETYKKTRNMKWGNVCNIIIRSPTKTKHIHLSPKRKSLFRNSRVVRKPFNKKTLI